MLLNDVDNLCMPHLFFVHVCTIWNYDNLKELANFVHRQNKQPWAVFSALVCKKDEEICTNTGTQFFYEGTVTQVEGVN